MCLLDTREVHSGMRLHALSSPVTEKFTGSKNTYSDLEKASRLIGLDEQELADRAIVHYLHSIRDEIELAEEFKAWDRASDEALVNMERELTNGA
jgi:hypothetical protein